MTVSVVIYLLGCWMHYQIFVRPRLTRHEPITGLHWLMVIFWPVAVVIDMLISAWNQARYPRRER